MKKCPYCAEEIQDRAIRCKHCKKDLPLADLPMDETPKGAGIPHPKAINSALDGGMKNSKLKESLNKKNVLAKQYGIILLLIICIIFWYFGIPAIACWYLWKKTKFSKKIKIYATIGLVVISIVSFISFEAYRRAPTLVISSPADQAIVATTTVLIAGSVDPKNSTVQINGRSETVDSNGSFKLEYDLPLPDSVINIIAIHHGITSERKLTVHRPLTVQETVDQATQAAAQKKAVADAEAAAKAAATKAKADEAAWNNSKAGLLCSKHLEWTKDDCTHVVNKKIWIGMTYDMLVTVYGGKPSSANPSNYGNGTQWQWCWSDYHPSCFYGGDDGVITSYN